MSEETGGPIVSDNDRLGIFASISIASVGMNDMVYLSSKKHDVSRIMSERIMLTRMNRNSIELSRYPKPSPSVKGTQSPPAI